jgi:NAD(P)-dependent dehydrogenase (short-subunit alcohol dehydrogenase family)
MAIAKHFVKQGAQVCATGRNEEALKALQAEIGCFYAVGDLTEDGVCPRIVDEAVQQLGGLTTLVNNAGVLKGGAFGTDACNLENFDHNFKANTRAPFELMTLAIPHLIEAGKTAGPIMSIVAISSVNGLQSFAGLGTYCGSKAAIDHMARCAAVDLAPHGIRVNNVNPGVTITPLQKRGGMTDEAYDAFIKRSVEVTHPFGKALGTLSTPEDVADLVSFLVSPQAKFITGECIAIDGGRQCLGAR